MLVEENTFVQFSADIFPS